MTSLHVNCARASALLRAVAKALGGDPVLLQIDGVAARRASVTGGALINRRQGDLIAVTNASTTTRIAANGEGNGRARLRREQGSKVDQLHTNGAVAEEGEVEGQGLVRGGARVPPARAAVGRPHTSKGHRRHHGHS